MKPCDSKPWLFCCLLGLLLISVPTKCQEEEDGNQDEIELDYLTHEQTQKVHQGMDRNSDGKASLDEVLQYAAHMRKIISQRDIKTVVEEMDGDGDGKLSLEEVLKDIDQWAAEDEEEKKLAEARRKLETEKFKVADSNHDGFLAAEEVPALFYPETHDGVLEIATRASMREKDLDGDSELTPKEFWEGDVAEDADLQISEEETKDFNQLDKDKSGKLNIDELMAWESGIFHTTEAMKAMFDLADKDGDLHVTFDELNNAREQISGSDAQYHLMEWAENIEL